MHLINYQLTWPVLALSVIGATIALIGRDKRLAVVFIWIVVVYLFFTYIANSDDTNGDIDDYKGYFDLQVDIVDPEGVSLNSHLWWAKEGPTVQLDLTYPMTALVGKGLNFYLHAQYFSGYAETLLHYTERKDVFRLGFSIVR